MRESLKEKILNNTFVDKVRNELKVDEEEYQALNQILNELIVLLKVQKDIDKELALILYSMPQIIRNTFLSLEASNEKVSDLANRLEDIWIELDELVIECLS
ncbi:hypothetical protein [Bacillus suaedaesalsae]|uniref:Uncharacterized protein n=1 Tax=Bacillus suaedaesalsae TaxID=2810349 RepID=A0ABS2DKN6_9BACI|nr:hypothetical protein [Bacillus suaedaesalsae]MBM6619034.1 hypothetical protein [Bacillus suaedaesalsae]